MTEAELEDMIMDNLEELQERGFPKMYSETFRQYRLKCGVVDILSSELYGDDKLKVKIIEIKKDAIDIDAVTQSLKYFNEVCSLFDKKDTSDYQVILIGASFCQKDLPILDYLSFISIYTYRYGVDGLWFEKHHTTTPYKLVEEKSDAGLILNSKKAKCRVHKKIFTRPNGDAVSITVKMILPTRGDSSYVILAVMARKKGENHFSFVIDWNEVILVADCDKETFRANKYYEYVSQAEILETKLELWQKIKPL